LVFTAYKIDETMEGHLFSCRDKDDENTVKKKFVVIPSI
jgi:hypothetical protein